MNKLKRWNDKYGDSERATKHRRLNEDDTVPRSDSSPSSHSCSESGDDGDGKDNAPPSHSCSESGDDGDGEYNAHPFYSQIDGPVTATLNEMGKASGTSRAFLPNISNDVEHYGPSGQRMPRTFVESFSSALASSSAATCFLCDGYLRLRRTSLRGPGRCHHEERTREGQHEEWTPDGLITCTNEGWDTHEDTETFEIQEFNVRAKLVSGLREGTKSSSKRCQPKTDIKHTSVVAIPELPGPEGRTRAVRLPVHGPVPFVNDGPDMQDRVKPERVERERLAPTPKPIASRPPHWSPPGRKTVKAEPVTPERLTQLPAKPKPIASQAPHWLPPDMPIVKTKFDGPKPLKGPQPEPLQQERSKKPTSAVADGYLVPHAKWGGDHRANLLHRLNAQWHTRLKAYSP